MKIREIKKATVLYRAAVENLAESQAHFAEENGMEEAYVEVFGVEPQKVLSAGFAFSNTISMR